MKHLTRIEARTKPLDNFWMKAAYRVPARLFPSTQRFVSQESPANTPITEIMVNSLITSPLSPEVKSGEMLTITGIAWDAGFGISTVEVSQDGGKSWTDAELGPDLGRYSFRAWQFATRPSSQGQARHPRQGDERDRPKPADDGARQSRGLSPQCGRAPRAHGGLNHDAAKFSHERCELRAVKPRGLKRTVSTLLTVGGLTVMLAAGFFLQAGKMARADETDIVLKEGHGRDAVLNNCGACHSVDYIPMNCPFLDKAGWDAEVDEDDQGLRRADRRC